MTQLGRFIKSYRDNHDLSLRSFAALSGLSHTYIEKLEKGADPRSGKPVVPTVLTLQAIAKATGLSLLEILQVSGYLPEIPSLTESTAVKEKETAYSEEDPEEKAFWHEAAKRDDIQLLLNEVKDLPPSAIRHLIKYVRLVHDEEN